MTFVALAALSSLLAALPWQRHPAPGPTPTVEPELRCPSIRIVIGVPLSSATAHDGQVFHFRNVDPVVVNDKIVIPSDKGDGIGVVTYVERAKRGGAKGLIVLDPRYFKMSVGHDIHVVADRDAAGGVAVGSDRNAPQYLNWVPGARFVLGAYESLHSGTNVTIPDGTILTVFVGDETEIDRCVNPPHLVPRRQTKEA